MESGMRTQSTMSDTYQDAQSAQLSAEAGNGKALVDHGAANPRTEALQLDSRESQEATA